MSYSLVGKRSPPWRKSRLLLGKRALVYTSHFRQPLKTPQKDSLSWIILRKFRYITVTVQKKCRWTYLEKFPDIIFWFKKRSLVISMSSPLFYPYLHITKGPYLSRFMARFWDSIWGLLNMTLYHNIHCNHKNDLRLKLPFILKSIPIHSSNFRI